MAESVAKSLRSDTAAGAAQHQARREKGLVNIGWRFAGGDCLSSSVNARGICRRSSRSTASEAMIIVEVISPVLQVARCNYDPALLPGLASLLNRRTPLARCCNRRGRGGGLQLRLRASLWRADPFTTDSPNFGPDEHSFRHVLRLAAGPAVFWVQLATGRHALLATLHSFFLAAGHLLRGRAAKQRSISIS